MDDATSDSTVTNQMVLGELQRIRKDLDFASTSKARHNIIVSGEQQIVASGISNAVKFSNYFYTATINVIFSAATNADSQLNLTIINDSNQAVPMQISMNSTLTQVRLKNVKLGQVFFVNNNTSGQTFTLYIDYIGFAYCNAEPEIVIGTA
jgi:hypothetical protein